MHPRVGGKMAVKENPQPCNKDKPVPVGFR